MIKFDGILALEGTDAVGKTTLARRLANQYGAAYVHRGAPTAPNWHAEYVEPLVTPDEPMVLDRWHLGEIVWPLIWNRKSLFDKTDDFKSCCDDLARLGVQLVVVTRDEDGIARTLIERGEESTIDDTLNAQKLYQILAALAEDYMPTFVVDSNQLCRSFPLREEHCWS